MSATLCLGEPIVDLIAEGLGNPVPHLGGATANVAVIAARAGARVALVGAAGDDEPGRWLHERLAREKVDVGGLRLVRGRATQVARVRLDADGVPSYALEEPEDCGLVAALGNDPAALLDDGANGLFLSSITLAAASDRAVTMALRERALARSPAIPVVIDVNLRLHRWRSRADAAASVNACVPHATLVRANEEEAALLTGESDPERAALALRKAGARTVVISLGSDGAIARGERRLALDLPAPRAHVRSTMGAGDALTGTLLAALERAGYYPDAAVAALEDGLAAAARACERWGSVD